MKFYIGLDVSLQDTSLCVVDEQGKVICEEKVPSDPESLMTTIEQMRLTTVERIGLEAGPLAPWLYHGLFDAGHPVVCVETRHMNSALKAQNIKTDRHDARGIAQMMRLGWYKPVHVKSHEAQRIRLLLTNRQCLMRKRISLDNEIRGTLKAFGFKIGRATAKTFPARVYELLAQDPSLLSYVEPLLRVREALQAEFAGLDRAVRHLAKTDEIIGRLMTIPGVGPVTATTFKATIDNPHRFKRSQNVGIHLGLTPRRYASGEIDRTGGITKCGDHMMRATLYEAANVLLTSAKPSWLKAWGLRLAKRSNSRVARTAVARRLAVIMHRLWVDGTVFELRKPSLADGNV